MEKSIDLFSNIKNEYDSLSKAHKKVSDYIMKHYDRCAFMTASSLAKECDVSESTIVRFAYALGYDGYPELQKELQEVIKTQLTIIQRAKMSFENLNEGEILENVLKNDSHNIKQTLTKIDHSTFKYIVNKIVNCTGCIYIVGLRTSTSLAEYLSYYLELMLDNVKLIKYDYVDMFEKMISISSKDVVIGISLPRYTSRTCDLMKYAKDKGASLVAITDSLNSPIGELSDDVLIAMSDMSSIVDSLVAPLSVINALIVAVASKKREEVKNKFENFEELWKSRNTFRD